jgi:large subunit ribosomal protein L21
MAEKTAKLSSELSRPSAKADAGIATRKSTTGKKAVILTGGKQYLVEPGQELNVELLDPATKPSFDALLVIDGENTSVGSPLVDGVKVTADIVEQVVKADKVTAIRYKAKKRVNKKRGHRQKLTRIKITKIA